MAGSQGLTVTLCGDQITPSNWHDNQKAEQMQIICESQFHPGTPYFLGVHDTS
jgi:hypothetical protein